MKKLSAIFILIFAILVFAPLDYFSQVNSIKNKSKTCIVFAKRGDTIRSIAKRYELSVTELAKFNGLFENTVLPKEREIILFYKDNNKPTGCISLKNQ